MLSDALTRSDAVGDDALSDDAVGGKGGTPGVVHREQPEEALAKPGAVAHTDEAVGGKDASQGILPASQGILPASQGILPASLTRFMTVNAPCEEPVDIGFTIYSVTEVDPVNASFNCDLKIICRWHERSLENDPGMLSLLAHNQFANGDVRGLIRSHGLEDPAA